MNRVSLFVFAAALLLAVCNSSTAVAADASAEEQLQSVMAKLKRQNPGFDGKETHVIEDGQVVQLVFSSAGVTDLSPIRELNGLKRLFCRGKRESRPLADLSPLRGLRLTELDCSVSQVGDLSPLAGMPLEQLNCGSTRVTDLTPLKNAPLTRLNIWCAPVTSLTPIGNSQLNWMNCIGARIEDFSPLRGLPLEELHCDIKSSRDRQIVSSIKTLRILNGKDVAAALGSSVAGESNPARTETPRVAGMADMSAQKDARKFARNQSSIKGLYVVRTDAGLRVGGAQDIIATAERTNNDRETICDFVTDVAKDTQISMEEAERLLKVRYPVWQAGCKVRFSYSNKYTKQAGGSAGGAFSVLLLSLLDGMQIDPGFAMTGDVTVDGKIREVGAVAEKLRGALLDKCRIVAIPEANKESLNDLAVLYSPAMLWSMQILSITTLDDTAAAARVNRAPDLIKALDLFGQVQWSLSQNATVYALRNPAIVQTLQQVLQLAPNHASAEYMLRVANNQLPATLSLGGSLDEIWAAAGPLLGFLFSEYTEPEKSKRYYFDKVPSGAFKAAMDRLNWLQFRLHPKTRELKTALADYMLSLDQLHRQSAFSSGTLRLHLAKRDKVLSEAHLLGTDRKTLEEMMH